MISGRISGGQQAVVAIDIIDGEGDSHPVEVVLDTGFTGSLSMPADVVHRLGLQPVGQRTFELASGELFEFDVYLAEVTWHGRPTDALVLESESAPLLGMALLWGSRITLDATIGGNVTIEEVDWER